MKKLLLSLLFVLIPLLAKAELKVKFKFTAAEAMSVAFQDGKLLRLPLASVYGVVLAVPFEGFTWVGEGAIATPSTQFTPAYRLITGPVVPINQKWSFGATVMLQHRPEYEGGLSASNLVGMGIGPGVKIIEGLTLLVIVGGSKVLEDGGPFSLAVQPKLSFDLPF